MDEIGNVDQKLRFSLKESKDNDIPLRETIIMEDYAKGGIEVKKDLKSSRNYDYYDMISTNRNKNREQENIKKPEQSENLNLNLHTEETVKINTEENQKERRKRKKTWERDG